MSSHTVFKFLKNHEGTAYTLKYLKKKIKTPNLWKKLKQLHTFDMINSINAVVDYPHYRNAHVKYYYVGEINKYVPRPKQVMV